MPFYEYECACGAKVEVFRKVADVDKPPEGDEIPPCKAELHPHTCEFKRILGATQTTFKYNDRTAHKS